MSVSLISPSLTGEGDTLIFPKGKPVARKKAPVVEIEVVELELPPPVSARAVVDAYPYMSTPIRKDESYKWLVYSASACAIAVSILTVVALVVLITGGLS